MKSCSDIRGELGSAPAHGTGHWPGSRGTPGRFPITGAALGFCLPVSMDTRGIFGYTLPCITLQPQQRGWGWRDLWFHPNPFSGTVFPLQGGAEGELLPPTGCLLCQGGTRDCTWCSLTSLAPSLPLFYKQLVGFYN